MERIPGSKAPYNERENIDVRYSFSSESSQWDVVILDLNNGFSVGISTDDGHQRERCMLDYQFADMTTARLHLSPGEGHKDTLQQKLGRLALWGATIKTYDALMAQNADKNLSKASVIKMLAEHSIPRLETVVLPTSNETLVKIIGRFGAQNSMKWSDLVSITKRDTWRERGPKA